MAELCSCELTRSNSDAASSLTAENSGDILPLPSADARPDKCMAWTNEMHNKYLDSLEATFVQQLHQLSSSPAWCTEQNRSGKDSFKRLPVSVNNASEQLAVLQDGKWQKRIFKKDDRPLSYISTIKIPRMHCQRRAGKDSSLFFADPKERNEFHCVEEYLEGKRAFSSGSASSSDQNTINTWYHNSVGSIKEGSGQNFVDEDYEYDPNDNSSAKRLKPAVEYSSSEDQIVPSEKIPAFGKSIGSNSTLEGKANRKDSSKRF